LLNEKYNEAERDAAARWFLCVTLATGKANRTASTLKEWPFDRVPTFLSTINPFGEANLTVKDKEKAAAPQRYLTED
jgi:hypothetical protein